MPMELYYQPVRRRGPWLPRNIEANNKYVLEYAKKNAAATVTTEHKSLQTYQEIEILRIERSEAFKDKIKRKLLRTKPSKSEVEIQIVKIESPAVPPSFDGLYQELTRLQCVLQVMIRDADLDSEIERKTVPAFIRVLRARNFDAPLVFKANVYEPLTFAIFGLKVKENRIESSRKYSMQLDLTFPGNNSTSQTYLFEGMQIDQDGAYALSSFVENIFELDNPPSPGKFNVHVLSRDDTTGQPKSHSINWKLSLKATWSHYHSQEAISQAPSPAVPVPNELVVRYVYSNCVRDQDTLTCLWCERKHFESIDMFKCHLKINHPRVHFEFEVGDDRRMLKVRILQSPASMETGLDSLFQAGGGWSIAPFDSTRAELIQKSLEEVTVAPSGPLVRLDTPPPALGPPVPRKTADTNTHQVQSQPELPSEATFVEDAGPSDSHQLQNQPELPSEATFVNDDALPAIESSSPQPAPKRKRETEQVAFDDADTITSTKRIKRKFPVPTINIPSGAPRSLRLLTSTFRPIEADEELSDSDVDVEIGISERDLQTPLVPSFEIRPRDTPGFVFFVRAWNSHCKGERLSSDFFLPSSLARFVSMWRKELAFNEMFLRYFIDRVQALRVCGAITEETEAACMERVGFLTELEKTQRAENAVPAAATTTTSTTTRMTRKGKERLRAG